MSEPLTLFSDADKINLEAMPMFQEDERTELKRCLTKDVKKSIVAFANAGGGKIYFGIDDDGEVVGLEDMSADAESLSGMIREGIHGDLTLYTHITQEKMEGKDVLVVEILDAPNKPYYLSDKGLKSSGVYLRIGNTSSPVSDEAIRKMISDSGLVHFEDGISVHQNLGFSGFETLLKERNESLSENAKKTFGILNLDGKYTNLGLLLSEECPYSIKISIFEGKDDFIFKDRKEFGGSLFTQLVEAERYINIFNRTRAYISGLKRVDTRDYPVYAIRETLLNALSHRDYGYSGSILISLYDDRLEITSLGGLAKGLTVSDIVLGISQPRNPKLAKIFLHMGYVESFGTGIKKIMQSYKTHPKKPTFITSENVFKVILPNINYKEEKEKRDYAVPIEEMIKEYLAINGYMTRRNVETVLGVSPTSAKNILSECRKEGVIEAIGKGKNTKYVLK